MVHHSHLPHPPHLTCSVSLPWTLGYLWSPSSLSPQHYALVFDLSRFPPRSRIAGPCATRLASLGAATCSPHWRDGPYPTSNARGPLFATPSLTFSGSLQVVPIRGMSGECILMMALTSKHLWGSERSCPSLHHTAAVQLSPSIRFTHLMSVWSPSCWVLIIPGIFQVAVSG